jgi:protein phosphatase
MSGKSLIKAASVFMAKGSYPFQEDHAICIQEKKIFAVADGFGGPGAGVEAAKQACEATRGFLEKEAGDLEATLPFVLRSYFSLAGNVLFNALIHANRKVLKLNQGKNVNEKGGSSLLAGFMDGDLVALASVGCCSAWLFREGQMRELVIPRTFARLCEPFSTEPREELKAPLMAIGMAEDLEPEIVEYRIKPGDWLLLQTDGITERTRTELLSIKQMKFNYEDAVGKATECLKNGNYQDNASVSLIIF